MIAASDPPTRAGSGPAPVEGRLPMKMKMISNGSRATAPMALPRAASARTKARAIAAAAATGPLRSTPTAAHTAEQRCEHEPGEHPPAPGYRQGASELEKDGRHRGGSHSGEPGESHRNPHRDRGGEHEANREDRRRSAPLRVACDERAQCGGSSELQDRGERVGQGIGRCVAGPLCAPADEAVGPDEHGAVGLHSVELLEAAGRGLEIAGVADREDLDGHPPRPGGLLGRRAPRVDRPAR